MSSVTSISLQPADYLMQSTTVRQLTNRATKFVGSQREIAPTTASDLSFIYPEAVVASSQPLGWQNLRALAMRQTIAEWTTPPLENHCLIIQLGASIDVTARLGEESFEQNLRTYIPSSSASTMAGSDPPSRRGITYLAAFTVRISIHRLHRRGRIRHFND